jgi:hypothetical protein
MDLRQFEIEKLKDFIKKHQNKFMEIASNKIDHKEFF